MTDPQSLKWRRCTCSDCAPMGPDSSTIGNDGPAESLDWTLTDDDVRSWASAERVTDEMPIRSRVWRSGR